MNVQSPSVVCGAGRAESGVQKAICGMHIAGCAVRARSAACVYSSRFPVYGRQTTARSCKMGRSGNVVSDPTI